MTTGDSNDMIARLQRWLPSRWFPTHTGTRIYATLAGYASSLSQVFSQLSYVKLQTRIKTATDGFLDLISWDYFGPTLPRHTGESDNNFRQRILANVLRPRVTRQGLTVTLKTLTGRTPHLFEPIRIADTGALGSTGTHAAPYIGCDLAGGWTDYNLFPYQMMIVAYLGNGATAADIYAAVEVARPVATVAWVAILPSRMHFGDAINSGYVPACVGGH